MSQPLKHVTSFSRQEARRTPGRGVDMHANGDGGQRACCAHYRGRLCFELEMHVYTLQYGNNYVVCKLPYIHFGLLIRTTYKFMYD